MPLVPPPYDQGDRVTTIAQTCRCGRPTRDHAYACDDCADKLQKALGEVPFVDTELETSAAKQKGVDYRRQGGGKGGKAAPVGNKRIHGDQTQDPLTLDAPDLGAASQPDPANMAAADARAHLKALLVSWALYCHTEGVRNSDPRDGLPADNAPALSRWLMWRVDGLMLHDIAADAIDEIHDAVTAGLRIIDRPADKQYLGDCTGCQVGRLYAPPNGTWARCNTCDTVTSADPVREALMRKLDDRLCTAAEIADLSIYMGLHASREQVRNKVNVWHKRDTIQAASRVGEAPLFKFGDVSRMLILANDRDSDRKVG